MESSKRLDRHSSCAGRCQRPVCDSAARACERGCPHSGYQTARRAGKARQSSAYASPRSHRLKHMPVERIVHHDDGSWRIPPSSRQAFVVGGEVFLPVSAQLRAPPRRRGAFAPQPRQSASARFSRSPGSLEGRTKHLSTAPRTPLSGRSTPAYSRPAAWRSGPSISQKMAS